MNGPDSPAAAASPVVFRYERLLAFRLIDAARRLREEAPELCAQTAFLDNWRAVEQSSAEFLFRLVGQPILDGWVQTARALLSVGAHKRYPSAHPSRHLKDFSRLLLSWASDMPEGFEGEVELLGRRAFPLMHGHQLLLLNGRTTGAKLSWRTDGRVLSIGLQGAGTIAEVNLGNPAESHALTSQCELKVAPVVAGLTLDVWTPEFNGNASNDLEILRAPLEEAGERLKTEQEQFINSVCRCVTYAPAGAEWVAGLIKISDPAAEATPEGLAELAGRDLVRRLLKITPIRFDAPLANVGGDFNEALVRLCARRIADRFLGRASVSADDELWRTVRNYVSGVKHGETFLRELGEDVDVVAAPASDTASSPAHAEATRESTERAPDGLPAVTLRKTRSASDTPVDWHAPDALVHLSQTQLEQLYERAVVNWRESEASAYRAAVLAYVLGKFEESRAHLLKCLECDGDVEEYRHLFAFSLRHLGRIGDFEQIIFGAAGQPLDLKSFAG